MTKRFPQYFHIHIGNNTLLPVHVYESTLHSKKKKQEKKQDTTHWFTDDHQKELYELLKPFLKAKLEKAKGRNSHTVSMDGKTIEIIRGKKIQFTYEFKPKSTKYYVLSEDLMKTSLAFESQQVTNFYLVLLVEEYDPSLKSEGSEFITHYFEKNSQDKK